MLLIYVLLGILVCFPPVLFFLIWPGRSTRSMRAPFERRNFAHRGLHTPDKSVPENSLAAFRAAVRAGYGIELDIQFTKDEQIVVFHDDTLDRVCGVHGRVDDYTLKELTSFSLCGTGERIPLFSEVLSLVGGRVPLIVELKSGRKNSLLCSKSLRLLRRYQGPYCVESFNPLIVAWFRFHAPDILRGQLSASIAEFREEAPAYRAFFLSYLLTNVAARPHFIAYDKKTRPFTAGLAELLGAMSVVWTVRPGDPIDKIAAFHDAVIFEFYRPPIRNRRGSASRR